MEFILCQRDNHLGEIRRKGFCITDWSCGNNKSITKGDRLSSFARAKSREELSEQGLLIQSPYGKFENRFHPSCRLKS